MKKLYILLLAMITLLAGCRDDLLYDPEFGEGEGNITATVVFSPVLNSLNGTRADGKALNHINSLCVFLYNRDGKLIKRFSALSPNDQHELKDLKIDNNTALAGTWKPSNWTTETTDETTTPTATFTLEGIPFGRYYIYAVANMGNLEKYDDEALATPEQLRSIPLTWYDELDTNDEMFGFFCKADEAYSNGYEAPQVIVNKNMVDLKAWLKRAASKVTVAVDGSQLYDGVKVWIKSIQIRDIPDMCWLGRPNTAPQHLIEEGEKIVLSESEYAGDGESAENLVTNAKTYPTNISDAHLPDSKNSLFFYENMQGEGQLKSQVWPESEGGKPYEPMYPDGNNNTSDGYKDKKIDGTYVEVVGYYENKTSHGPIIYRFMLGKDPQRDYNAERNYHYKLTLKLKGNANENDWHIVYEQKPDIFLREPFYVSYLYNTGMPYNIRVVGGELVKLEATIPDDEVTKASWAPKDGDVTPEDIRSLREIVPPGGEVGQYVYWPVDKVNNPGPWNGFLSLREERYEGESSDGYGIFVPGNDAYSPNNPSTYTANKTHWNTYRQGERVYYENGVVDGNDVEVVKTAPGEYSCKIPLYTKARVMVSQTGYTGNNPYAAYQRASRIQLKATFKDESIVVKTVDVIQSRRVMNPKAIWRRGDNTESFHVELKILPYQTAEAFENLKSDGPWHAEIIKGQEFLSIRPEEGVSQQNPDMSISGSRDPYGEDNYIDFHIDFNGTTTTPRGGMIKVYYNNNTCVHTIFVRQGYDPVSFYGSNTMWHTYNLRTASEEVTDPELEGSYFRQYNTGLPIATSSNTSGLAFQNGNTRSFTVALPGGATESKTWNQITTTNSSWPSSFNVNVVGRTTASRLPTKADWENIIKNSRTIFGYGVLYTDGANKTQDEKEVAFGASSTSHTSQGMRGVILCDEQTGTQIFLPLAASGYGRFKQGTSDPVYNRLPGGYMGVIQYANRYSWYPNTGTYGVSYKPLFYDIWKGEGTMYWTAEGDGAPWALDINFNTLDIVVGKANQDGLGLLWSYGNPSPNSGTDAVHIRLVHDR